MQYVELACRGTLGLVFLVALGGKVTGWRAFVASVPGLAPGLPAVPVAAGVAGAEGCAIVLLALRPAAGYLLAGALLAAFAAAIALAVRRGDRASCRCFGRASAPLGPTQIVRNLLLTALACAGLIAPAAAWEPAGAALALVVAALLAAVFVFFDDLADLLIERNI